MPAEGLESRIARLRREIERLSDKHTKIMEQRAPTTSAQVRAADAKRAEILAKRIRQLNEMLDALKRGPSN
jgi:hypothetical protein